VGEVERVRIEIAFDGGQIMGALVTPEGADELQRRLDSAQDGALELDAADGRYIVALRRIVYVKRFARESRVGFSSG
jgi:hypothetical protein